jgi:hypothetical protein
MGQSGASGNAGQFKQRSAEKPTYQLVLTVLPTI